MAPLVLFHRQELCEGPSERGQEEDRVVAEAPGAARRVCQLALGGPLDESLRPPWSHQREDAAEARNPRHGFVHYVPPGSIKKGEDLVKTGGNGKTVPCAVCHGPDLRGLGEVPPIANRDLLYVVRQLNDMQTGARTGTWVPLMKAVVDKMTLDDMIAVAAYIGTLEL